MLIYRVLHRLMEEAHADGDLAGTGGSQQGEQGTSGREGAGDAPDAATAAVEAEAAKMGWTPKDQFKGDPAKWRPADEFVERGKNLMPLLQAQVKKQDRELAELRQVTKDFAAHLSKTEQRAYDRAFTDLKAQRAEAITAGDAETFGKVDDQIAELRKEVDAKAVKAAPAAETDDPVYNEWATRNATWLKDPKMEAFGTAAAGYLRASGETAQGAEFLDLVAKEVKAKFPEKFTNPRREAAAAVEGAAPGARKGGKGFADMPADARAACDRMAKNAFSGDQKAQEKFKADFVKNYDWE